MRRALFVSLVSSIPFVVTVACGGAAKKSDDKAEKKADSKSDEKANDEKTGGEGGAPGGDSAQAWEWKLPAGINDPPSVPDDNPISADKVALGHELFMDKRLSGDGSRSCYSCHQNELGNADGLAKALGAGDKPLTRNTPTIWNVGYHPALYWDGRAPSLEKQAVGAIKGGNMGVGADNLAAKAKELGDLPDYRPKFEKAFGLASGAEITMDHIAAALSSYERTLLCGDTVFDNNGMDDAQKRGWDLFRGKASCTTCHSGDNFSDGLFHNVGIGFDDKGAATDSADVGHGKPAKDEAENYKFRTPTLRNVAKTAPYFHDGSVATLEEAVAYMTKGGTPKAQNFDPNLRDNGLSDAEVGDLVAFLRALDCPGQLEVIGPQAVAGITDRNK